MVTTTDKQAPQSIDAFVQLMAEHGRRKIWFVAFLPDKKADDEVRQFRKRYFPDRRSFSIAELIPFIQHDHRIWPLTVLVVERALKDDGIIEREHHSSSYFDAPREWIPDSYAA